MRLKLIAGTRGPFHYESTSMYTALARKYEFEFLVYCRTGIYEVF